MTVARDRETGNSRGFAFVNFYKKEDAAKAMENLENFELDNHKVKLWWALDKGKPAHKHRGVAKTKDARKYKTTW